MKINVSVDEIAGRGGPRLFGAARANPGVGWGHQHAQLRIVLARPSGLDRDSLPVPRGGLFQGPGLARVPQGSSPVISGVAWSDPGHGQYPVDAALDIVAVGVVLLS